MIPIAFAAVALLSQSDPYVRKRVTPGDATSHCLWWQSGSLTLRQNQLGNPATGGSEFTAVSTAWNNWEAVMNNCGNLALVEGARTASRQVGYDPNNSDLNQNIVLFRQTLCRVVAPSGDSCWNTPGDCGNKYDCWDYSQGTIALTTSTYDQNTGRMFDADIELNAHDFYFTTVDSPICPAGVQSQSCVVYDVQNAVTHEMGHALGLDHTNYPGSTMNPTAPQGDTSKRTIDQGSQSFVCAVYPKGTISVDCVESKKGCSQAGGALMAWLSILTALALRKR